MLITILSRVKQVSYSYLLLVNKLSTHHTILLQSTVSIELQCLCSVEKLDVDYLLVTGTGVVVPECMISVVEKRNTTIVPGTTVQYKYFL